jgi:sugar lactone lactonase YvrE/enterochelin esterase-like enzyme
MRAMPTELTRRSALIVMLIASSLAAPSPAAEPELGPDSKPQAGVPQGKVTQHRWTASKVFPGTERDYWVYVPAQYDGSTPACVTIFQDGGGFQDSHGSYRATVVMDNLIHKKEMPVTIGVFINPGVVPAAGPDRHPRYNRSFEYDTPSDQYARFLLEEILPEVGKTYKLTNDATGRAICGTSSGGICAFAAAWERPEAFSRVVSFIGSFTDLRGGNDYPGLVRKTEPKALRVFMQDGKNDLDIYSGSWWIENQNLDAALTFAGYEHVFVTGEGGHDAKQPGAVLPDALRYVWKDYPKLPARGTFPNAARDSRPSVIDVVDPNEPWQLVGEGYKFTEGPAADANGNVFFTDVGDNKIYRVGADGKVSLFADNTEGANGLMFGKDGRLYAAQGKRVVAYTIADATPHKVADDVEGNDLAIAADGGIYVTEPGRKQLTYINPKGEKRVVDKFGDNTFANGVILTPDQGQLIVAETRSRNLFAYRVEPDGSLSNKQPYYTLHLPAFDNDGGADGLTVDTEGRLYVTSHLGLQIFDQAGRVNVILPSPQRAWLANVCFGGKDLDTLYVACQDKVYKRKTKAKGVASALGAHLPPQPKL